MVEIREAPVPVMAWDIHESGNEIALLIAPAVYETFVFFSQRPLRVRLSNGQTVMVRAKK